MLMFEVSTGVNLFCIKNKQQVQMIEINKYNSIKSLAGEKIHSEFLKIITT